MFRLLEGMGAGRTTARLAKTLGMEERALDDLRTLFWTAVSGPPGRRRRGSGLSAKQAAKTLVLRMQAGETAEAAAAGLGLDLARFLGIARKSLQAFKGGHATGRVRHAHLPQTSPEGSLANWKTLLRGVIGRRSLAAIAAEAGLRPEQVAVVRARLLDAVDVSEARSIPVAKPKKCPYCEGESFNIHGGRKAGRTRYICSTCGDTFTDGTERRLAEEWLRQQAAMRFLQGLESGASFADAARDAGLDVLVVIGLKPGQAARSVAGDGEGDRT
jgi:transposase-like protein